MADSALLIIAPLVLYIITGGKRFGHLSVVSLFIYAQATMAVGTMPMLQPGNDADETHAFLLISTFWALVGAATIYSFSALRTTRAEYNPNVSYDYPRGATWTWIIISIVISALYYLSIGYLAFFESIEAIARGTGEDIAGLRLESYAGSRYFFPGYVNQFKNALLPALVVVVTVGAFHARRGGRFLVSATLISSTIVFLLGTGQRGAFVIAMGLAFVAAYFITPKRFARYGAPIVLIALPLFLLATFATGRAGDTIAQAEGLNKLGVLVDQLTSRIFGGNQMSSVVGFRYIYTQDIPLASEWGQSIIGLLPGQGGSDLANRIFEVLYGSTRGTSPLSLWGSAYHNLGMFGAISLALLLALILCRIASKTNSLTATNLIQLVGLAGVTIILGTWIADGPVSVLNKGLPVYVVLWWWGSRLQRSLSAHEPLAVRVEQ